MWNDVITSNKQKIQNDVRATGREGDKATKQPNDLLCWREAEGMSQMSMITNNFSRKIHRTYIYSGFASVILLYINVIAGGAHLLKYDTIATDTGK